MSRNVFFFICAEVCCCNFDPPSRTGDRGVVSNNPPVFIIRAATAGDRERHLRKKRRDNGKNDNRVRGEWVQRWKRWRGLIEERAQELRDMSDTRDDGCRKKGWRTRTGRWREGRDGRELLWVDKYAGEGKQKGEAQEEVEVGNVEEGEKMQPTSPSLWVIVSSLLLYSQSSLHSAFPRRFQQKALMLRVRNHETKMLNT